MVEREHNRNHKGVKIVTTKVQKWGNSLAIRIPKNVADQIEIDQGTEIEMYVEDKVLTVTSKKKKITLDELLAGVTDENRHTEIDFGSEGDESL